MKEISRRIYAKIKFDLQIRVNTRSPSRFESGRAKVLFVVGIDLLSRGINPSTISAGRLNDSVRNGKRWNPAAKDTNMS